MEFFRGARENRSARVVGVTIDEFQSNWKSFARVLRLEITLGAEIYWLSVHFGKRDADTEP